MLMLNFISQLIKKEKVVKKIITLFTCFFLVLGFAQTSSAESDTLKKLKKQGYATATVA